MADELFPIFRKCPNCGRDSVPRPGGPQFDPDIRHQPDGTVALMCPWCRAPLLLDATRQKVTLLKEMPEPQEPEPKADTDAAAYWQGKCEKYYKLYLEAVEKLAELYAKDNPVPVPVEIAPVDAIPG